MPLRLLKENMSSMMRGIHLSDLPKTFRDALVVTRALGQRYIWIDSLCIIQDSAEDWSRESIKMHEIYLYSVCNISGTASRGSSTGLFYPRSTDALHPLQLYVMYEGVMQWCYVDNPMRWRLEVEVAPLHQRAWVLQERILSPGNLLFGAKQVLWECRTIIASEVFPKLVPSRYYMRRTKQELSQGLFASSPSDVNVDRSNTWENLLLNYTRCDITFVTDKLVAIGGLAAWFGKGSGDTYLAGMWKENLLWDLVWYCEARGEREKVYTAPSWSWASVGDGTLNVSWRKEFQDRGCQLLVTLIDVKVNLEGDSDFGRVDGGWLILEGRLAKAKFRKGKGKILDSSLVETENGMKEMVTEFEDENWTQLWWDRTQVAFSKTEREDGLDLRSDVFLLPVFAREEMKGLVLKRNTNKEFYRLGMFRAFGQERINVVLEGCAWFEGRAGEMGLETYDGEHGPRQRITII